MGRLSTEKNHVALLSALGRLVDGGHDVRAVIFGEGYERSNLEAKAQELGIAERVLMPGFMEKPQRLFPLFDVFVLPSLTEGLPITLLEAMLKGLPVVATDVGGIPRALRGGDAGHVVPKGNVVALTEGIRAALLDKKETDERAALAKSIVLSEYSSKVMCDSYISVYEGVISGKH